MIASVTKEKVGVVTVLDEARHGLEDGDVVKFSEVQGMVELNEREMKVNVLGPYTFSIDDTSEFSDYEWGGVIVQVKQPKEISFRPLSESLVDLGEPLMTNFAKFCSPGLMHISYQTLHAWVEREGSSPRPWHGDDATNFVALAKEMFPEQITDENFVSQFSKLYSGELTIATVLGGIVTQEVMKASSGKLAAAAQASHKVTEYFPIRRSERKRKAEILKEEMEEIEARLLANDDSALGIDVAYIENKGRGIVPTRPFVKGEFVVEYAGDLMDIGMAKDLEAKYSLDTSKGCYMYYFKHKGKQYW